MGTIRVEAVPVQSYFLGLLGFDHLQLVFQDEDSLLDAQDYWFVIEGIQDGPLSAATLGASGESGVLSLGVANGAGRDELIDKIGTPETRGSRIVQTGPNAWSTWQSMAEYAGQIDDAQLPYIAASLPFSARPTINSTSLASSVLWSVGIDLNNLMPFKMRLSPGPATILGTTADNDITVEGNYTSLATGPGNDSLRGSANTIWAEKFHAGFGDDTIYWSYGPNIMHGGQDDIHYILDGTDTIDYTGVGLATIVANEYAIDHKTPAYLTIFAGGIDQLYSIEQVKWSRSNDVVVAGKGVLLIERPFTVDLSDHTGDRGDELGMSESTTPLLVNFVTDEMISVQIEANEGLDAGYWVKSAEWFTGSSADDRIYAGASLTGVEGGEGDDLIDGRFVAASSGLSPNGYDIEIYGDDGDDTIVSGGGSTYAQGGAGSDLFVLSTMSGSDGNVEFVIDDADNDDKLYIPYSFFTPARGNYDDSELFQLSGGVFKLDDITKTSFFYWGPVDNDQFSGNIDFAGSVKYSMSDSDLLIRVSQGQIITETVDNGPNEPPGPTITYIHSDAETTATIRVTNWTEGKLGLTFPVTYNSAAESQGDVLSDYPGFMSAVNAATSADRFIDALASRPDSHLPKELVETTAVTARAAAPPATDGTSGNDTIHATFGGPYKISGRAGDDNITASDGGDFIDGGSGGDIMRGGRGNDVYVVDSASDQVIELDRGGFDTVYASINYQLGAFVEHVTLDGTAVSATGNALRNTLVGNAVNNMLSSGDGDDKLAGNGGDDTLIGGGGGDAYIWEIGDGRDNIIETGTTGKDVIVLAGDLKPGDVIFIRNPDSPLDLILRFSDGGGLTIKSYFAASSSTIEGIEFLSGGAWAAEDLSVRAASATVTRNEAPVATDDIYAFAGGSSVPIPVEALLANDHDSDGDALTIQALSNIQGGSAVLDGNGNIVVTRASSAEGHVSFDYTISDGNGGTAQASFDVSMIDNAAPIITTSSFSPVREDQAANGRLTATDSDGDTLSYRLKEGSAPAKGSIKINADGTFTYTPNANANGTDGFTLTVSDGLSDPVEKRFNFIIAPVNDAPVALSDGGYKVHSGSTLSIAANKLLGNDIDPDRDTFAIASVTAIRGGTVVLNAGGSVTFTAGTAYRGPAAFNYTITDGHGGVSTAIVNLEVTNTGPVARPDTGFTVKAGQSIKIAASQVLRNDTDLDGDTLSIAAVANVAGGTVLRAPDGGITFKADAGRIGPAAFTYTATDGHGGTSTATVNLSVLNNAPVARADSGFTVTAGQAIHLSATSLLRNDSDSDGHNLSINSVTSVKGGTVVRSADGGVSFKALADYSGPASFNYKISDGHGGSSAAAVALTIKPAISVTSSVIGTPGRDILSGTPGNDQFFGKGDVDVFVFKPGSGHDAINDFQASGFWRRPHDVIDLTAYHLSGYVDLIGHIERSGTDTVIELDANNSIRLKGVSPLELWFDHFKIA